MKHISFQRQVPYSPRQMLDLVSDVASYPQFVPHCENMRIEPDRSASDKNSVLANMSVAYGPVSGNYTSRVQTNETEMTVSAKALDGPFSHLQSVWHFTEAETGCDVSFELDFEFSNPLLAAIAEPIFTRMQEEVIEAFFARAKLLYA